jgi:hypothetical protein
VDLSGLIFVALALVWAVVLIPRALRAHDDAARTRSVPASSEGARVLVRTGRRSAPTTPTALAVDPAAGDLSAAVAGQRGRAAAAARRRRRVLGLLVLVTTAIGGASVAGVLAPWAPAVPGGLVVAFLVLARVLVRREHAQWRATLRSVRGTADSSASEEAAADGVPGHPVEQKPSPEPELHVVARNDQGVAVVSDTEDTSSLDAATLAAAVGDPAGTLWDPLPVTLPTYVDKPRATRSVRTIDLRGPGVSSSGHDAGDSALVADAEPGSEGHEPPAQRAVGS